MFLEEKNLIISKKRGNIERPLFLLVKKIKNQILKEDYTLSINFISPKIAQDLNIKYRDKDYIPNILSFPLDKKEGEIFICLSVVKKEAKNFSLSYKNFLTLIIIHGCLHLNGIDHGEKMEKLEEKFLQKYMIQ